MNHGLVKISFVLTLVVMLALVNPVELRGHHKTIKGKVMLKNGKSEPVIGASVRLVGTVLGAHTNKKGVFTIKNIPDGKFEVLVSSVGLKAIRDSIELMHYEGDEYEMNFEMEESPVQSADIVVTATRSEKIYDDIPIKMSTIDQRYLNISSSENLREGLQYQPGVRTEVNCQNCGFSQVRINGMEGKYTQILIDGKPIFSALNGVYGLEQLPVNMIERVEVIRGGGSALYGGNAIAGVINILTKEPCLNSYNIQYTNSFFDNTNQERVLNMNGTIVNDNQDMGITLFGMLNNREAFDANGDGFSEIGELTVNTFGLKHFWKLNPHNKLSSEFHTIYHKIRGGNKFDLPEHQSDITESAEHNTFLGQINYETFLGRNKAGAYLSFQTTKRNSYYGSNQDLNAYGTTDNHTIAAGVNYSHIINDFLGDHILIFGYEFNLDEMTDLAPAYDRRIEQKTVTNGVYIQDDWSINEDIYFLWGARFDKHNLIKDLVFNPRASLMWKGIDNLTLRATYSTGYRAPQAFDEDLHITQVGGEGLVIKVADDLKPEYSYSYSFSADYSLRALNIPVAISLELFNNKLNGAFTLVDNGEDAIGNRILLRTNGESALVTGMTAELQSELSNYLFLKAGVTIQNSKYEVPVEWSAGDEELDIPAQFSDRFFKSPDFYGYFLASYTLLQNWTFDFSANFTGPMYLPHYAGFIENDELKLTESFFELNLKLTYKLTRNPDLKLSIGCFNILNSYQSDFDIGVDRDAGYMYGPFRPITPFVSISVGY